MDGLRSPFIIHDPGCPYTYDEEQIITVSGMLISGLSLIIRPLLI